MPSPITIVNSLFILWLHNRHEEKKRAHKREHGESKEVEKKERKWVNDVNLHNSIPSKMGRLTNKREKVWTSVDMI